MIKPLKKLWKRVTRSENTVVDRPKAPSQAPAIKAKPGREFQKQKQRKKTAAHKRPRPKEWDPQSFQVPVAEGKTRFHDLGLPDAIIHAIADLGFQYCTPIQAEILPSTLKGKDATGRAQTGTGKTAAFLITVLALMLRKPSGAKRKTGTPRVLVIAPTRELVLQIAEEAQALCKYTSITTTSVFGGMDYEKQRRRLNNKRTDIVVATPGRLLDFKRRKDVDLSQVEVMIIDEADRMLDMGFIPDVRKIIYSTPHKSKRQTLLFSATLTPEVTRLTEQWTRHPVTVEIEPEQVAVDSVNQLVYIVTSEEKNALLYNIVTRKNLERVIVFCNRKDETRRLAEVLEGRAINCAILSGDVRQHKRIRTLEDFKSGKIRVLVATDVAGRGIHIEGMDHVINYTLPRDPEDYVHRIGRTGRAGAAGTSISFADEDDSFHIPAIEALLGNELPCIYPEDEWLAPLPPASKRPGKSNKQHAVSHRKANPRNKRGGRPQRGRRPPRGRTPAKPRSGKRPS